MLLFLRLVIETAWHFLVYPEKFLFFEVSGLSSLARGNFGDSVDLLLYLDKPAKPTLPVSADTFCLHATPVINTFKKIVEPIRIEHRKTEYRVLPDLRRIDATEVLSVDSVTATLAGSSAQTREYEPLYSTRHNSDEHGPPGGYWQLQRRLSGRKGDNGTDLFISFCDLSAHQVDPVEETVIVRVTCSNRDLPAKLPFGDPKGDFETELAAPVEAIRCLTKPTATLRPALGGAIQWRLISHLSLNYLSLVDGGEDALKEILTLYDFGNSAATRQQINGIVSLKSSHVTRRIGPSFCRGLQITIEFDEDKYVGTGLYLFASVLERFLGQYVSVNSFVQVVAKTIQGAEILKKWPPRNGNRIIL